MKVIIKGVIIIAVLYLMPVKPSHAIDVSVGSGFMYYTWEEHLSGGNVKETGYLPTLHGYVAGAPLKEVSELRLRFDVQGFVGQVDYDTKTQVGTPVQTDSDYWGIKASGSAGWRLTSGQSYVKPFIGLAYSFWKRDIESTNIAIGYPEYYNILYSKVGIQTSITFEHANTIQLTFSADPMLWTREEVDYPGAGKVVVTNGRRLGWTLEGVMTWWQLEAKAYWQAVRLGTSNVVSGLQQPKSDQDMIGFQLGYLF